MEYGRGSDVGQGEVVGKTARVIPRVTPTPEHKEGFWWMILWRWEV